MSKKVLTLTQEFFNRITGVDAVTIECSTTDANVLVTCLVGDDYEIKSVPFQTFAKAVRLPKHAAIAKVEHELMSNDFRILVHDPMNEMPENGMFDEATQTWRDQNAPLKNTQTKADGDVIRAVRRNV